MVPDWCDACTHCAASHRTALTHASKGRKASKRKQELDELFNAAEQMEQLLVAQKRVLGKRPMIPCVFWLVQKSLLLQETPLFLDESKHSLNVQHLQVASKIFDDMFIAQRLPFGSECSQEDDIMFYFQRLERTRTLTEDELYALSDQAKQTLPRSSGPLLRVPTGTTATTALSTSGGLPKPVAAVSPRKARAPSGGAEPVSMRDPSPRPPTSDDDVLDRASPASTSSERLPDDDEGDLQSSKVHNLNLLAEASRKLREEARAGVVSPQVRWEASFALLCAERWLCAARALAAASGLAGQSACLLCARLTRASLQGRGAANAEPVCQWPRAGGQGQGRAFAFFAAEAELAGDGRRQTVEPRQHTSQPA